MMNQISDLLSWRYATKAFDPKKNVSSEHENSILEAIRMAPSSFGLQFFRVVLVKNKDTRSKLRTAGYSQSQFTDSALLLVFCVKKEISDKDIEKHVRLTAKARNQSVEELEGYKQMLLGYINNKSQDELSIWASKQAYIALGFAIFAAASMEIDTCPMEGFDNSRFDEVLSLHDKNLKSVVSLAVGYRSQDDKAAANAKVRLHESEMFIRS